VAKAASAMAAKISGGCASLWSGGGKNVPIWFRAVEHVAWMGAAAFSLCCCVSFASLATVFFRISCALRSWCLFSGSAFTRATNTAPIGSRRRRVVTTIVFIFAALICVRGFCTPPLRLHAAAAEQRLVLPGAVRLLRGISLLRDPPWHSRKTAAACGCWACAPLSR